MSDWYCVSREQAGIRVEFIPSKDRFWPPEILANQPLLVEDFAGQRVILTGPGAVWMYAHAAAAFRKAGAKRVTVESPGVPGTSEDLTGSECRLVHARENEVLGTLFYVNLRSSPHLSPSAVDRLLQDAMEELPRVRPQDIVLSGRASVEVYARIAVAAIDAGAGRITCWSARDGLVVIFDSGGGELGTPNTQPEWLAEALSRPKSPLIIGVIGDPNHGKSVFSGVLDMYRQQLAIEGWRLDCDGQAPTPPWYLSMDDQEQARRIRDFQKLPWTAEMEEAIAEQLKLSRERFSVLIADLPGGNHTVNPPQRVPPGRERLFSEIDALILLGGRDTRSECGWREALKPHGFEDRIAAVLSSDDPEGKPSLRGQRDGNIWRGVVTGLDRSRSAQDLVTAFQPELDQLWKAVLNQLSKDPTHDGDPATKATFE